MWPFLLFVVCDRCVCVYVTRCCVVCLVLEPPRTTMHYYSANDVPTRVSCPMFACCHCTMYYTRGRVFHYIAISGSIPVAVNVISCFDSCFEHWSWNHPNRTSHSCAAKGMTRSVSCIAWTCSVPTMLYMCCLLYTSPSPRDGLLSRMPSSA